MDVLQNRATFNIVRDKLDGELLLKPVMVNIIYLKKKSKLKKFESKSFNKKKLH